MDGEERYRFLIADIREEAEFLMDLAAINAKLARQSGNYAAAGTLGLYLAQDIAQDYMQAGDLRSYQFYSLVRLFCEYEELVNAAISERFLRTLEFDAYVSWPDICPLEEIED
ncbi:hypothetical protein [Pseudovibrio exalbescens]|uniref:Uncharacterized protein n=1 Tax=Pseudovibrio exalbescens TaxID=197461 RepID=A0A1U7JDX0_9HYPH|nr:hypothetical protein [Pseudovibrio exalbescens]OKL42917.1 hypothetical protein A3843_16295 [Pseudovibrio exalbescens]